MKNGFSLIEILISLAIICIISAIAIPNYSHHIAHAKRVEAEISLSKLATALEQYALIHNTYKNATLETMHITPLKNYQLDILSTSDSSFLLIAQPLADQAINDSQCGTLTLNSMGEKKASGSDNAIECWS